MINLIGCEIGHYKLLRLVDYDLSTHVYLGEHKYNRSYGAVKISSTEGANRQIKGWLVETSMLSRLNHPHIIHMCEFGTQDGVQFLVTDWAVQGTLFNLFVQSVSITTVIRYVKQIASALQHLHMMQIIHRDIKPANILVDQGGRVLLADFETAIDYKNCQSRTGTPPYMAPEQRLGQPCPASDQYALGALVYEWLCGEFPFYGSSAGIVDQPCKALLHSLQEKVPALPSGVDQVLTTALAEDPASRFTSVEVFAGELEQACRSSSYWTTPRAIHGYFSIAESGTIDDDDPII
jgi:eukaryotic-like serine/threonine-protein kinase